MKKERLKKRRCKNDMHFFSKLIWRSVHKDNLCSLIVIVGQVGKGKSYVAQKIGYDLNGEKYDVRFQTVFRASDLIERIKDKRTKKGTVFVFEEAGVNLSSRDWFNTLNKTLISMLEVFRYKNLVLILTLPHFAFLDNRAREMTNYLIKVNTYDKKRQINKVWIKRLQLNRQTGKIYYKRLKKLKPDGQLIYLNSIEFKKAPDKVTDEYEIYSMENKERMLAEFSERLKEDEKVEKGVDAIFEEVSKNINNYEMEKIGKLNAQLRSRFNIGRSKADEIIVRLEDDGFI